jgi:hypothetical protein
MSGDAACGAMNPGKGGRGDAGTSRRGASMGDSEAHRSGGGDMGNRRATDDTRGGGDVRSRRHAPGTTRGGGRADMRPRGLGRPMHAGAHR